VEENDGRAFTALEVVEANAVDVDEAPGGRMLPFDLAGTVGVVESCGSESRGPGHERHAALLGQVGLVGGVGLYPARERANIHPQSPK
jgi:hypothetical protein